MSDFEQRSLMKQSSLAEPTVLHLINGEHYAGAERVQDLLAQNLPKFGYRVAFACLKSGKFQRQLELGPHLAQSFTMRSRLDALTVAKRVAQFARITGSSLLHSHTARSALIGMIVSRLTGTPLVHHVHSPTERDSTRWLQNRLNVLVEYVSLANVKALVPVSSSLERHLIDAGYQSDLIQMIPNGVPLHSASAHACQSSGRPFTAGVIGLFRPRKGLEVLLGALAELLSKGVDIRLRAVGSFEDVQYQHAIEHLSREKGLTDRINWRGFRDDVFAEFEEMDALVLPSLFGEGMPMVILEAMSVGLPVIASRIEGIPELVRQNQEGFLVEPGSVSDLTTALARCVQEPDLMNTLGLQAKRRQQQNFSDLIMAERISKLYDHVLPGAVKVRIEE